MNCKKAISLLVLITLILTFFPVVLVEACPSDIGAAPTILPIKVNNTFLVGTHMVLAVSATLSIAVVELKFFGTFGFPGPPESIVRFCTAVYRIILKNFTADYNISNECSTCTGERTVIMPYQADVSLSA